MIFQERQVSCFLEDQLLGKKKEDRVVISIFASLFTLSFFFCYTGSMAGQSAFFNWDQLLDGDPHTVDLDHYPAFEGGLNTVRALAYRIAEQRRHTVTTHKLDPTRLQIQAHGIRPPCSCGAHPGGRHQETCTTLKQHQPQPAPPTVGLHAGLNEASGQGDDELLGPCTCGLAPTCLPDCARVGAAAA